MTVPHVLNSIPKIWIPLKLEDAVSIKNQYGSNALYIAGATLLQLKWQAGQSMPHHHIYLEKISELQEMKIEDQQLILGSFTKLSTICSEPMITAVFPILAEAVKTIAAPAIRNLGTIGGNIMWGEGDLIPLFLAMKVRLTFLDKQGFQTVSLADWIKAENKNEDALLVTIEIPKISNLISYTFYKKIGRRETFTAAIVTVAGQISLSESSVISDVNIAIGGGTNKPILLTKIKGYMLGKTVKQLNWKNIYQLILEEFHPNSDPFISGMYKQKAAANLILSELRRLLLRGEKKGACV